MAFGYGKWIEIVVSDSINLFPKAKDKHLWADSTKLTHLIWLSLVSFLQNSPKFPKTCSKLQFNSLTTRSKPWIAPTTKRQQIRLGTPHGQLKNGNVIWFSRLLINSNFFQTSNKILRLWSFDNGIKCIWQAYTAGVHPKNLDGWTIWWDVSRLNMRKTQ